MIAKITRVYGVGGYETTTSALFLCSLSDECFPFQSGGNEKEVEGQVPQMLLLYSTQDEGEVNEKKSERDRKSINSTVELFFCFNLILLLPRANTLRCTQKESIQTKTISSFFSFGFTEAAKECPKDGINKFPRAFLFLSPISNCSGRSIPSTHPRISRCWLEPSRSPFISFIAVICRVLPFTTISLFLLTHFFHKNCSFAKHFVYSATQFGCSVSQPDPDTDSNAAIL